MGRRAGGKACCIGAQGFDKLLATMSWQLVTITMVPQPHPSSNSDSPVSRRPTEPAVFRLGWEVGAVKRESRHNVCIVDGTQLFFQTPLRDKALNPPSGNEIRL